MKELGIDAKAEWLETDGMGGFASGTVAGPRTRRYHALLLAAARPPADRFVLVNGAEAGVETPNGTFALSSQTYDPGVVHPDGHARIDSFTDDPCPRWTYKLEDGTVVEQEVIVPKGIPAVLLRFKLVGRKSKAALTVRPLMSGRGFHSLQGENGSFRFEPEERDGGLRWRAYEGVPAVVAFTNGAYTHAPDWYRRFLYEAERDRGLDCKEDLATPGFFRWDLGKGEAWLLLVADLPGAVASIPARAGKVDAGRLRKNELARRAAFPSRLHRSADAYVARRGEGSTIIAGYPWFGDWGRDTFIAMRGICLAAGRLEEAGQILREWAGAVSGGMLPNRFPDRGEEPEYNSVDASLWYVIACREYVKACEAAGRKIPSSEERALAEAVAAILVGYARGTRYGIRLDADGLVASGEPGVQLTWMDAKVGDWVVTPRTGKAVEIQALWLNAIAAAGEWSPLKPEVFEKGLRSFRDRFWIPEGGYLKDVVDMDHVPGRADATFRPNQIFAAGGLPLSLLDAAAARRVVDAVEAKLVTPLGPRSLAPGEAGYSPRYEGGVRERDGAYHQGTVWPWLAGPFVEAWVRVRGGGADVRAEARKRFLDPLTRHLSEAGLGHVSEIADAEAPHTPRGCPFQAWSVGEMLRLDAVVLKAPAAARPARTKTRRPGPAPKSPRRAAL